MSKDMLENIATQQPMIGESVFNTVGHSLKSEKTQGGNGRKNKMKKNNSNSICIEFRRFDTENACWTRDVINSVIKYDEKFCKYCFYPKKFKKVFEDVPNHKRIIFRLGDWWLLDMISKEWTRLTDVYEGCLNKHQSVCGCKFKELIHISDVYLKFDIPADYRINHIFKSSEYTAIRKLNAIEFPNNVEMKMDKLKEPIEIVDNDDSFPSLGGNKYSEELLVNNFDNSVFKLHEGKSVSEILIEVENKKNWNSYVKIPVKDENGLSYVRQEIRRDRYVDDEPQPNWCKINRKKQGRGNRKRGNKSKKNISE